MSELVSKFGWNNIITTVLGGLLLGAILALFSMHSDLVALKSVIEERQKNAVKVERLAIVEAQARENAKELEQLREWLRTLSGRVNTR